MVNILKEFVPESINYAILRVMKRLEFHVSTATRTKQRVFAECFLEQFGKWHARKDPETERIWRGV